MNPIEAAILRTNYIRLSFTTPDLASVPQFLRTSTSPIDDDISSSDSGVCLFEPLAMMQTTLSPEQFESIGMMFRGAWVSSVNDQCTVHFSFGRYIPNKRPLSEFIEQCRLALLKFSDEALWSASCWKFLCENYTEGIHVLDFRFGSPSPVTNADEMRSRMCGNIVTVVDVIAIYPAIGRELRKAA